MYINKPQSPEELYKFFIKGMPLKPTRQGYRYDFWRKGWNVYTHFIQYKDGNEATRIEFYSAISAYHPDWILGPLKYVDTQTKDSQ